MALTEAVGCRFSVRYDVSQEPALPKNAVEGRRIQPEDFLDRLVDVIAAILRVILNHEDEHIVGALVLCNETVIST